MTFKTSHKTVCFFSALMLLGVLMNSPAKAQENALEWKPFEDAVAMGQEQQKPILVDVWAPWCGWCKKIQKEVYPELSAILQDDFVLTRLNRDDNESKKKFQNYSLTPLRLAQKLNVQTVPAVVFLSPEGEYLFHITGFTDQKKMKEFLELVSADT
ncbi:MAG: thioredoxin fold domain-containing protein [Bacteroidetes bacterium]|jgi:thioredoxin-related protein|nr:thioredoxin fold domain-containing protein [Bacteroidota bacterium]